MQLLQLFRIPNLLILVATLYLVTIGVIHPPLVSNGLAPSMTTKDYLLFLFIALCVGAGGYLYNDLMDVEADTHNERKPVIGRTITRKAIMFAYWFLVVGALFLVLALSIEIERLDLIPVYLFFVVLLWSYNRFFQKVPFIGNIIVAGLCSSAVFIPYYLEYPVLNVLAREDAPSYQIMIAILGGFFVFSFLSNLIREVIKDLQDIEGDRLAGYQTAPVYYGELFCKKVSFVLTVLLALSIIVWSWIIYREQALLGMFSVGILIPPHF